MYIKKLGILSPGLLAAAIFLALALCIMGPGRAWAEPCAQGDCGRVAPVAEDKSVLSVEPQSAYVNVGETFTVTLRVQAGSNQVDVASAYLNFNPKVLQVVTLVPGQALPEIGWWLGGFIDNDLGHINYGAYAELGVPGPSGSFDLATIQLQALRPSVGTNLSFSMDGDRKTELVATGYPLPLTAMDGRVIINEPIPLTEKVNLPLISVK